MSFSKRFPAKVKGSMYPEWKEVYLSEAEEKSAEAKAREENIRIFEECLSDAEEIFKKHKLKNYQTDLIHAAIALFEKKASHSIYWKEDKAKEKFDKETKF